MAGGGAQKDGDAITEINITPLVDVCLVLVIIFMAVAPFALTVGIKVLETRAQAAEGRSGIDENVTVNLAQDGRLTVNGAPVELAALRQRLLEALAKSKDRMVVVSADEKNRVGQVVEILDTAQQSGARKLAILKSEPASPARKG